MRIAATIIITLLCLSGPAISGDADLYCLASTMSGEARGGGEAGMLAVADVVLTRSELSHQSVCKVVTKPKQFKGYGHKPTPEIIALARSALAGRGRGSTKGATHFSAEWDRPYWSRKMRVTAKIGGNTFYAPD